MKLISVVVALVSTLVLTSCGNPDTAGTNTPVSGAATSPTEDYEIPDESMLGDEIVGESQLHDLAEAGIHLIAQYDDGEIDKEETEGQAGALADRAEQYRFQLETVGDDKLQPVAFEMQTALNDLATSANAETAEDTRKTLVWVAQKLEE